jgi:hypothetical protein
MIAKSLKIQFLKNINKSIMNLEDVEVLSKNKQRNVIKVGNDVGRSKKGRQ